MRGTLLFVALLILLAAMSSEGATTVQTLHDASIGHDQAAGLWMINSGGATLTVAVDSSRDFQIVSLVSPSTQSWLVGPVASTQVTVSGVPLAFGSRAAGFQYENASTSNDGHVLRLDASFVLPSVGLRAVRHIVVAPGSPTFEIWTSFQAVGPPVPVTNLNAFQLVVPAGTIHWLNGLQGDNAGTVIDSAFTRQQQILAVGQSLALGAQGRSSEHTVPWIAIDGAQDEFYAGLVWSGAWSFTADRLNIGLGLSLGLPPMTTMMGSTPVDGPHALFGVARGGLPGASAALQAYVFQGARGGRAINPLVTYNTWFAYGTEIDEESMREGMTRAAALGVELFVIDAGWYAGAGATGPMDFDSGLGSWEVDPVRFPDGLKPLTDYAHSLGMKFGIWVEPERVNLSTVGAAGTDESSLATNGGSYGSDHSGQVCLASEAARQWVLDRLSAFIDAVQPDYLKWDNNMWINCDRAGHGHGAADGNFAHVNGLYDLLSTLRDRYPDLVIENVSGGGNRLDFGMLKYTDVAWMDDRTAPSVHVRHNLEGLSAAFPPAYLLSFVTDHDGEPLRAAPDLSLYFRSRMGGTLGLCFLTDTLSDDDLAGIGREVAIYKKLRGTLVSAAAALLTAQAAASNGPEWDALQATAPGGAASLVLAYEADDGNHSVTVKPTGLKPDVTYMVQSIELGLLGSATGAALMTDGIEVVHSSATAAHILTLAAAAP